MAYPAHRHGTRCSHASPDAVYAGADAVGLGLSRACGWPSCPHRLVSIGFGEPHRPIASGRLLGAQLPAVGNLVARHYHYFCRGLLVHLSTGGGDTGK